VKNNCYGAALLIYGSGSAGKILALLWSCSTQDGSSSAKISMKHINEGGAAPYGSDLLNNKNSFTV
jgi:hypothetical protein